MNQDFETQFTAPEVPAEAKSKATSSLVFGILSLALQFFLGCGLGTIAGLIMAILGQKAAKAYAALTDKADGKVTAGRILSTIGLVLSIISLVLIVLLIAFYILYIVVIVLGIGLMGVGAGMY